jgi:hypothetical protein
LAVITFGVVGVGLAGAATGFGALAFPHPASSTAAMPMPTVEMMWWLRAMDDPLVS